MELDDFKATWQSNQFITEAKEMSEIHKMIQKTMITILGRLKKRYGNLVTSSLISSIAFVLFFYTISDEFRESPAGLVLGVVMILSITGFAWSRYRQFTSLDYASTLNNSLQALVGQLKRNLAQEQVLVIGAAIIVLVVPRLFNGRGFPDLLQPDIAIGLILAIIFAGTALFFIRRSYQRDIKELQSLLAQLAGE